jgi:hypothetical protein
VPGERFELSTNGLQNQLKAVEHLKEHGDKWRLNEEIESPVEPHSTPSSFTEAHRHKKD